MLRDEMLDRSSASLLGEECSDGIAILEPGALTPGQDGVARLHLLSAAFTRLANDPGVSAMVLICPPDPPGPVVFLDGLAALRRLCDWLDAAEKPVIAVLSGQLGGDMAELALAAHYRLGTADLTLCLPEVTLGLPPRAGASQRLARLCGAAYTLKLLLGAKPQPAAAGFLDLPGSPSARDLAIRLAASGPPPRTSAAQRAGLRDQAAFLGAVRAARALVPGGVHPAVARIVDCVEAVLAVPFASALDMERTAFADCLQAPDCRARLRLARAEQICWQIPEAAGRDARPPSRIAILGGSRMAAGLVLACLDAGLGTLLIEYDPAGRAAVQRYVTAALDARVARGSLTAGERVFQLSRLRLDASLEDLASVDAVWEGASDSIALKTELWQAVGLFAPPDALLCASDGVLALAALGAATERAGGVVGLVPVGPAQTATLFELVVPQTPSPEAVARACALVRVLGRGLVRCADRAGFATHRLRTALEQKIEALLACGACAEAIDTALIDWGFTVAPCHALDLEGLDKVVARRREIAWRSGKPAGTIGLLETLVEKGFTGRASGQGLSAWEGRVRTGDHPRSRRLMDEVAASRGLAPGAPSVDEIQRACLAALVNAGAHLVEDGTLLRFGDVDVAAVAAVGFPRGRGGPMTAADHAGCHGVLRDLRIAPDGTPVSALFVARCQGPGFDDKAAGAGFR